jgi:hypothetical protein
MDTTRRKPIFVFFLPLVESKVCWLFLHFVIEGSLTHCEVQRDVTKKNDTAEQREVTGQE